MSESNKRRRTSLDTYVAVSDQENAQPDSNRPTTPKRSSYQSPTKASLARSNPTALQLLDQAKQRRESEPNRRQSLRDAVLGNKSNQQAQRTSNQHSQAPESDKTASQRRANTEKWIEDSFKDIDPAPLIPTPKRPYHPPIPSSAIVPRLVKSNTAVSSEQARRSTSVELPPTPVQLGKEDPPERPRGLLTSSPGGSGRRRVRVRHGNIHSSPLKPRELPPVLPEEDEEHDEVASGIGDEPEDLPARSGDTPDLELVADEVGDISGDEMLDEALSPDINGREMDQVENADEIDIEGGHGSNDITEEEPQPDPTVETFLEQTEHDNDPKLQEKLRRFNAFQEQLKALTRKCSDLENLSKKLEENDISEDPFEKLKAVELLLASYEDPPRRQVPQPEDNEVFKENAAKYLTSFAPHGLRMSYETWEQNVAGSQKFVYQTTFGAPACWPQSTLRTTFDVVVDLESENVEAVKYIPGPNVPRPLTEWIEEQTADHLSRHDMATISTGVAAYFQEATKRARIFKYLDDVRSDEEVPKPALELSVTDPVEAISLSQYIADSFHVSRLDEGSMVKTRRSLGNAKQIMLIYEIKLDWIGRASATVGIAGSNLSESVIDSAKKLFGGKLAIDGIIAAFLAVKSTLEAGDQIKVKAGAAKGKGKARRMTGADFA